MTLAESVRELLTEIQAEVQDNFDYADDTGATAIVDMAKFLEEIDTALARLCDELEFGE